MRIDAALWEDYAKALTKQAQIIEKRAEIFHRDTNRDKYHHLLGQAAMARATGEAMAWLAAENDPPPAERRMWVVP